jgi:anti-anti-sigma factor
MHDFEDLRRAPFAFDVERVDGLALIKVTGDFGIVLEATLEEEIEELIAADARQIVIDLRGARSIDSHGVRLLVKYELRSRAREFQFGVIPAAGEIRRVFETMGIDRLLRLESDLASLDEAASRV